MLMKGNPDSLIEIIEMSKMSRRGLMQGMGAMAGASALGLSASPAFAATTMTWMGWQGYETPITAGTFLADNDINFQPTFIGSNEEIIAKLQAGGIGQIDIIKANHSLNVCLFSRINNYNLLRN